MNEEPCIICGRQALCSPVSGQADTCDYRCDNCGNYFFQDEQNEDDYKELDAEERERISNYVSEYNKATGKWATLGDLKTLWQEIDDFNRTRQREQ